MAKEGNRQYFIILESQRGDPLVWELAWENHSSKKSHRDVGTLTFKVRETLTKLKVFINSSAQP